MSEAITTRTIQSYSIENGFWNHEDYLVVEEAYKLSVEGRYIHSLYCCPTDMEELVVGNLAAQGVIQNASQVGSIDIRGHEIEVRLRDVNQDISGSADSNDSVFCYARDVLELMKQHLAASELHKMTGGVHLMGLARGNQIIAARQDVGRHNALDKLFGYCLLNNIDLRDKMLLSSGRVSHEIMQKVVAMGIKIIISRAAVTSLAVQVALENGVTVLGFTRGSRFNIYTYPDRILLK